MEYVRQNPDDEGLTVPVYGKAATMPTRGLVDDLLDRYIDMLYRP
ncbi:hypothetical protein ACFL0Q_05145 [Thermodesulfobacteriota bacterium]